MDDGKMIIILFTTRYGYEFVLRLGSCKLLIAIVKVVTNWIIEPTW